jgi:N-acetylmuramoyl-L-alanine amidase
MHLYGVNTLEKIYLHKAPLAQDMHLELAKLVFCFSDEPQIQLVSTDLKPDGFKHESYLIAADEVGSSCKSRLKSLEHEVHPYYRVVCSEQQAPQSGIKVDLYYDPKQISCSFDQFDAITNHKGVVFRFINKNLIDQLSLQERSPIRVASLTKPSIVIDCAHGGSDPGAISCNGVFEKDITLQVGLTLAQLLKTEHYEAYVTRDNDFTIALDNRTAFINQIKPDLYLSIHANSSKKKDVHGLQTFCLDDHLFRHNHTIDPFQREIQKIYDRGNLLANSVHQHVLTHMHKEGHQLFDGKVRHAVAQLLLGTNIPGVLIELGFLSHPQESLCLTSAQYQQKIAQGICNGIRAYFAV